MSQNIFNDLFEKLSNEVKVKTKLLNSIEDAQEGIENIKSLFGNKKIEEQLKSSEAIIDIHKPFEVIDSLLAYKYRLTHNVSNNSKYNSLNAVDTENLIGKIDSSTDFILSIVLANHDKFKDVVSYGNNLVKIALNEGLSKKSYDAINQIIPDLKTDKELLKSIYWLNMPINGLCRKTITQKIVDSWTLDELLFIQKVELDDVSYSNKDLVHFIDQKSFLKSKSGEKRKVGSVFFEILDMKLDNSKISFPEVAYFMVYCTNATLFNRRSPAVCGLAQKLAFKMKANLSEYELDVLHKIFVDSNHFSVDNVIKISFLKNINKTIILKFLTSAIMNNNKDSAIEVLSNLMDIYVNNPLKLNKVGLFNKSGHWLDFRVSLDKIGIKLKEEDFMTLMMSKEVSSYENIKDFVKDWVLEDILEKEIPKKESVKIKTLKF